MPRPPYTAALDDAPDVLRRLAAGRGPGAGHSRETRRSLVAATHGLSKYQLPVLEALGLLPWLDDVLTPDLTGESKHSRNFYRAWPDTADLCVMTGDLYEDDVVPAHGFGFRTLWKVASIPELDGLDPFDRPAVYPFAAEQAVRPDAIIRSLAELPAVVERLEDAIHDA